MHLLPEKRYKQLFDDITGELTEDLRGGSAWVRIGETNARLFADMRSGTPEVRVEFSAPSVLHGHNRLPLALDVLPDLLREAWQVVRDEVADMPSFERVRLSRLDLARDLEGVENIPATLLAISQRPASRIRVDRLERGQSGQWQTLTRGTRKRWRAVAYGKAEQLREAASETYDVDRRALLLDAAGNSEGRLRWELQLRSAMLREQGLRDPDNYDQELLYAMSARYFERTRFADITDGGSQRLHDILTELTPTDRRGVLTVLSSDLIGLPIPLSHNPEDTYRRVVRDLKLSPQDLVGDDRDPRRLDFASGLELTSRRVAGQQGTLAASA
jgi:hypothetical protein